MLFCYQLKMIPLFLFLLTFLFSQTETTIKNGDASIFFKTFGSGKALVIINGGPGMNSEGFADLAKFLAKDRMTIIYDQRGTGKSKLTKLDSSTITMDLMLTDLEAIRNYLKLNSWTVLGHSFGGMLGSYYAANYPNSIDKLILSSSGGIDLDLRTYIRKKIDKKLSKENYQELMKQSEKIDQGDTTFITRYKRALALASAYVYNNKYVEVIGKRLTQGNHKINWLVWQNLEKIKFNCSSKLLAFKKPVLIIQGREDVIEEKTALKAQSVFVNSKLILLDKCGHYGWLDAKQEYFAEIESFLAQ